MASTPAKIEFSQRMPLADRMAAAMSALSYMSNQPISASGAKAIASCLLANQRASTQLGKCGSSMGRTRAGNTAMTVLAMGWGVLDRGYKRSNRTV